MSIVPSSDAEGPPHCKWCKRSFLETPHPRASALKKNPDRKLPRRTPRSGECQFCPQFLAQVYPKANASSTSRQEFLALLQQESSQQVTYNEKLDQWEARAQVRRKLVLGSHSGSEDAGQPRKKLKAKEVDEFVGETVVGVHWPLKILQAHPETKGLQISRRKKKMWNGVMGVVLPSTATTEIPDGCTKLLKRQSQVVESSTAVADSLTAVRAEQYYEAHQQARKHVAVTKQGSLHKVLDKDGKPAPITLSVPVAKQPDDPLRLFSAILPHSQILECGLSADSDSDVEKPTKKQKKGKDDKVKVDKESTPRKEKGKEKDSKAGLGESYRRLLFQVQEDILKITGEKLGKVSFEAFTKLVSKADEILNKADDNGETAELKEKVDLLRKAEPLIQSIDPPTVEEGYAPKVMDALREFSKWSGDKGVPFDDIVILALKRAVDSAVARGDWSGAIDLVLSEGSEGDVVNIKTVQGADQRQEARKGLFSKLLLSAPEEIGSQKPLSLMTQGGNIDEDHSEACKCVMTVMTANPDELNTDAIENLTQQLKVMKKPAFLFKVWAKSFNGCAIQDAAAKISIIQLSNMARKEALIALGEAPAFPRVAMDEQCTPWKVAPGLRKWMEYAKARSSHISFGLNSEILDKFANN